VTPFEQFAAAHFDQRYKGKYYSADYLAYEKQRLFIDLYALNQFVKRKSSIKKQINNKC